MTTGEKFERLVATMAQLRAPGGCPWDREQTFETIKKYTIEETYEVLDAIDARDWTALSGELGDYLLQAVFYAQMAAEQGLFSIADSLDAIHQKLVRRHPHVFADGVADTPDDVKRKWDEIKAGEKAAREGAPRALLDDVPRAMPALVEAQQVSSRAAGVGFDWATIEQVFDKLREELDELHAARASASADEIEDEFGDILFVMVNIARFLKTDPEQALRRANAKFRRRFGYVESRLAAAGRSPRESSIEEMEELWQQAKKELR